MNNNLYRTIESIDKFIAEYGPFIDFIDVEKENISQYILDILLNKKNEILSRSISTNIDQILFKYSIPYKWNNTNFTISIWKLKDDYYQYQLSIAHMGSGKVELYRFLCDGIDGLYSCIDNEIGIEYE